MKKIILMILAATILNFVLSETIFADEMDDILAPLDENKPPTAEDAASDKKIKDQIDSLSEAPKDSTESENQGLIEATFDVRKILTLPDGEQPAKYYNNKEGPLVAFILEIMNYATAIIGSIALILFIVAGFTMMLSEGNQQRVDKAKDIFKYAIIGLVVTFLSYIIVLFMQSVFITKASQT